MTTSHEQCMINRFLCLMHRAKSPELRIGCVHNSCCQGQQPLADVEFTTKSGHRWAIEAKYGSKTDRPNEVHRLFGNLLRETGRERPAACQFGLLLPGQLEEYYRNGVNRIPRCKFLAFGDLVPVARVYVLDADSVRYGNWGQFYDGEVIQSAQLCPHV